MDKKSLMWSYFGCLSLIIKKNTVLTPTSLFLTNTCKTAYFSHNKIIYYTSICGYSLNRGLDRESLCSLQQCTNNKAVEMLTHFTQSTHFSGLYRGGEWSEQTKYVIFDEPS